MSSWRRRRRGIRGGRREVGGAIGGRRRGIDMIVAGILGGRGTGMIVDGIVAEIVGEIEMDIERGRGIVIEDVDPLVSPHCRKYTEVVS
jgi:hypothetical protein